jgi:hypothetical protein
VSAPVLVPVLVPFPVPFPATLAQALVDSLGGLTTVIVTGDLDSGAGAGSGADFLSRDEEAVPTAPTALAESLLSNQSLAAPPMWRLPPSVAALVCTGVRQILCPWPYQQGGDLDDGNDGNDGSNLSRVWLQSLTAWDAAHTAALVRCAAFVALHDAEPGLDVGAPDPPLVCRCQGRSAATETKTNTKTETWTGTETGTATGAAKETGTGTVTGAAKETGTGTGTGAAKETGAEEGVITEEIEKDKETGTGAGQKVEMKMDMDTEVGTGIGAAAAKETGTDTWPKKRLQSLQLSSRPGPPSPPGDGAPLWPCIVRPVALVAVGGVSALMGPASTWELEQEHLLEVSISETRMRDSIARHALRLRVLVLRNNPDMVAPWASWASWESPRSAVARWGNVRHLDLSLNPHWRIGTTLLFEQLLALDKRPEKDGAGEENKREGEESKGGGAVSYTHLTLPTM